MAISAQDRYALAATIRITHHYQNGKSVTICRISEKPLGISKIYSAQIFTPPKQATPVLSVMGVQDGYRWVRMPGQIAAPDVIPPLLSKAHQSVFRKSA